MCDRCIHYRVLEICNYVEYKKLVIADFTQTKNQNNCSSSNVREKRELLDYAMWRAPAPNSCKRANQKRIGISKLY